MEQVPWQAFTAASGGWLLFGWLAWMVLRKLLSGDLITRREADQIREEAVRLRGSNDHLQEQLGVSLASSQTANEHLAALRRLAEEKAGA